MWISLLLATGATLCFAVGMRAGGAALLVWSVILLVRAFSPRPPVRSTHHPIHERYVFVFALVCAFLSGLVSGLFRGAKQLQQDYLRRNPRWWE